MHQEHLFYNAEALARAMKCLVRCTRLELAEQLLRPILNSTNERIPIPAEAITSMLRMYQIEQMTVETKDLIDDYIAAAGRMVPDVSQVSRSAFNWPRRGSTSLWTTVCYPQCSSGIVVVVVLRTVLPFEYFYRVGTTVLQYNTGCAMWNAKQLQSFGNSRNCS